MTSVYSSVHSPTGAVNTGSGNQYNYYTSALHRIRDPRLVARGELDDLANRFVKPIGYDKVGELLSRKSLALLSGPSGSGRQTAAKMALRRTDPSVRIQTLPDAPEGDDSRALFAENVSPGDHLLLDLSATDSESYESIQREVGEFREALERNLAQLAVVLPQGKRPIHELASFVVEIQKPDPRHVLFRHLVADQLLDLGINELTAAIFDRLDEYLSRVPMREIAQLVEYTKRARERYAGSSLVNWLEQARQASIDRMPEAVKALGELNNGRQRALLLATAMWEGASADTIFYSSERLLGALNHPDDGIPRLERQDLSTRLGEIGASIDDSRRVRFDAIAYDQAVRTLFWENCQHLRPGIGTWVDNELAIDKISERDRNSLAERFAHQVLRAGTPEVLFKKVEEWIARDRDSARGRFAESALRVALRHEAHGRFFRRGLYQWATDKQTPEDLAYVMVNLCLGLVAQTHPDQALVRLHHLARRQPPEGAGGAARYALARLLDQDRRLIWRMLYRLTDQPSTVSPHIDHALFLDLAKPAFVLAEQPGARSVIAIRAFRDRLTIGWTSVMRTEPAEFWTDVACAWLSAVFAGINQAERLLEILVRAAANAKSLSDLYVITWTWASDAEDRAALARRVSGAIDETQRAACVISPREEERP